MILSTHGIVASSILQVDPDWLAYYNRVIAAGGSLTTTEQNATKTLVADFKAYGIWSAMKAVYPMVGASAAACAQNLKSSSFTGTFTSGWTFASTGVTGNGTSAYMQTNLIPNTALSSVNSGHLSYYSRTNISSSQVEMGSVTAGSNPAFYLIFSFNGTGFSGINAVEGTRPSAASPTTGLLLGSRVNSTEEKYYLNNVSQTRTANSTSLSLLNTLIGCYNSVGTPNLFSTKECAFASIGDGLDATQASNFYTAIQAFQTTLSRQV